LIAGPGGAAGVLALKWMIERRRNNAETGLTIDQRWEKWSERLEERVTIAEREVTTLKDRVSELEDSLHASERQVVRLKQLLSSLAKWALTLKDELLKAGGSVPAMPLDVETALTALDDRA
jgi:predicted nuclease with TOPRIM domain